VQLLREAATLLRHERRAQKKAQNTVQELTEAAYRASERVEKLEAVQKESMRQADSELKTKMQLLAQKQAAILALSTPTIEVMDGVLALPIIGTLDDDRVSILTESLLAEIIRVRARWAILDLTGVSALDGRTARILSTVASAVRLLGARVMLSGIRSQVAQELVNLGQDIASLKTARTLKDALRFCSTTA
jgi:rsbT co-antagonist protein RsbR